MGPALLSASSAHGPGDFFLLGALMSENAELLLLQLFCPHHLDHLAPGVRAQWCSGIGTVMDSGFL